MTTMPGLNRGKAQPAWLSVAALEVQRGMKGEMSFAGVSAPGRTGGLPKENDMQNSSLPGKTRAIVDFVVEMFERERLAAWFAGSVG